MIRRYARRPPYGSRQNVDLFRFDIGDTCCFFVLTESGKSNEARIASRHEIFSLVKGQCSIWGLRQFKDQRIKPEQMREMAKLIWSAKIEEE
jgi:hypothetical protein